MLQPSQPEAIIAKKTRRKSSKLLVAMYQNGASSRGGSKPTASEPGTLQVLGRYELLGKLASGGMGEIHLARLRGEGGFEKLVVVKVLRPELTRVASFESMFLDEARIAGQLSHPNVCEVYELGRDGDRRFLVMQYLRGVPLTVAMKRRPEDDAAEHARAMAGAIAQACDGLHHAHELRDGDGVGLGVVHRDMSPSNLFVTTDGTVKVLDFGIAKARGATTETAADEIKGKYAYMSPEQIRGDVLDRRSDVFSLGIVLWEAMTGTRLFQRGSDVMCAKAIIEETIPRADEVEPAVPRALAEVAARALERQRDARFADALAFGQALRAALPGATPELGALVRTRFSDELTQREQSVQRATELARRRAESGTEATTQHHRPTGGGGMRLAIAGIVIAAAAGAALMGVRGCGGSAPGSVDAAAFAAVAPIDAAVADPPSPDAAVAEPAPPDAAIAMRRDKPPNTVRHSPSAPGTVSIESTPYATIYIDGVHAGVTPLIDLEVAPGRRRFRAVLPNGKEQRFTISITSGRRAPPRILSW
jgi:serine/threonine-protein kinase